MTASIRYLALAVFLIVLVNQPQDSKVAFTPTIPKTWDDVAMASVELPLATRGMTPVKVSADFYYRIPVMKIYKSYPVYAPGKEPPDYIEFLRQQDPQIVFDAIQLKTEEDWIKAGEVVFDAPLGTEPGISKPEELYVRVPAWYEATGTLVTRDGVMPYLRYVVREKGKVELGILSCASCHTRVLTDGSVIKGAQGNYPSDRAIAYSLRTRGFAGVRPLQRMLYAAPWLKDDLHNQLETMRPEEVATVFDLIPSGVNARHGTSPLQPVQIPDLIGVKERKYLDRTGLQRHRSMVDIMRYAASNQTGDLVSRYGQFQPLGVFGGPPQPTAIVRYSDEMLYALAFYLYSLKPPANPNKFDALAARGKKIFESEECSECHTPPLYTNNKLTVAEGFTVPPTDKLKYDIQPVSVKTDPTLALKTRRGTGYYKVPSLRGVWYRGPFEHSGSVATLEDWFDPSRLRSDYVPTGWKGYGVKNRAVKGHEFGLWLKPEDKAALIAFLRSL